MPPAERHPDGAMGAIIKKTSGRLWENKLVYYSFDNFYFGKLVLVSELSILTKLAFSDCSCESQRIKTKNILSQEKKIFIHSQCFLYKEFSE